MIIKTFLPTNICSPKNFIWSKMVPNVQTVYNSPKWSNGYPRGTLVIKGGKVSQGTKLKTKTVLESERQASHGRDHLSVFGANENPLTIVSSNTTTNTTNTNTTHRTYPACPESAPGRPPAWPA